MKKTKKKILWQQYIGVAFMMLMGAICGVVMVVYIDKFSGQTSLYKEILSLVCLFIAMYLAMFFHTIVHEAGHLVFGLLTGYKFCSFRIFSFMWIKEDNRLTLKRLTLAGTGGQCLMEPPQLKEGRMPVVLYNLGGSFANTVFGVLFAGCYFIWRDVPFAAAFLLIFAVVGIMFALMNGIPMRMGAVDNDGYNAFSVCRSTKSMEALWVQLMVAAQNAKGIRLKDMPAKWFAVPTDEDMKNSMVAVQGVFACNRLMDRQEFVQADALMAHLLEIDSGIVGVHRNLLICDRIFVELIGQNRSEAIEDMLTREQKKFMKSMKNYPSVIRTEYALALILQNNASKAEKIKQQFEKIAKTFPYPHETEAERELMTIAERCTESVKTE
ncbi:MAG: M50 family metallopeptidase [Oscillospiraceae bacterium]|nr:M50 family metallopeptidase [Oscillospiraceae bacterium]